MARNSPRLDGTKIHRFREITKKHQIMPYQKTKNNTLKNTRDLEDHPGDVHFSNFGKEHQHIYKELREKGVTGGPSIGFTHYHEKGENKIRGDEETCKKVIGYDCSSIYLKCTALEMATGWYTLRERKMVIVNNQGTVRRWLPILLYLSMS